MPETVFSLNCDIYQNSQICKYFRFNIVTLHIPSSKSLQHCMQVTAALYASHCSTVCRSFLAKDHLIHLMRSKVLKCSKNSCQCRSSKQKLYFDLKYLKMAQNCGIIVENAAKNSGHFHITLDKIINTKLSNKHYQLCFSPESSFYHKS